MKSMLPIIDRIASWLLAIGALLHGYGSYLAYPSLSKNWYGLVLAARLHCFWLPSTSCGSVAPWIGIVGAFAATLPNPIDTRG
jgi:hypothetical protein